MKSLQTRRNFLRLMSASAAAAAFGPSGEIGAKVGPGDAGAHKADDTLHIVEQRCSIVTSSYTWISVSCACSVTTEPTGSSRRLFESYGSE